MTPVEIYALEPIEIWSFLDYQELIFQHIPECNAYGDYLDTIYIKCKVYANKDFDSRRFWLLASIWFKNEPVMIIQNAGREGDDHTKRFITNVTSYCKMVSYIHTVLAKNYCKDIVPIDKNIPELTEFYGNELTR